MEGQIFELQAEVPAAGIAAERLATGPGYDLNRIAVAPGKGPKAERHPGGAFVAVLRGALDFTIDGDKLHAVSGQLVWVPGGAERSFIAGSEGAVILAAHLPA